MTGLGIFTALRLFGCWSAALCVDARRWILRQDPEAGIDMFAQMEPTIAPEAVLPILQVDTPHPDCF